jgi:hypothetical protein
VKEKNLDKPIPWVIDTKEFHIESEKALYPLGSLLAYAAKCLGLI